MKKDNKNVKSLTDNLEFFDPTDLSLLSDLLQCDITIDDLKIACKRALRRQRDSKYVVRTYDALNKKFDVRYMVEWGIITVSEANILSINCINNLFDLINFNLEELVCGTPSLIARFDKIRKFYDLCEYCDLDVAQKVAKKK